MKKLFLSIALAVLAAHGAAVKVATRDWVTGLFRDNGIYFHQSDVTTNANGSLTFSSPFTATNLPGAVAITFTVSASVATNTQVAVVRARLMDFLVGRLYADGGEGPPLELVLYSGGWVDDNKKVHAFLLDEGLTLRMRGVLPIMPIEEHVCNVPNNSDCNCVDYGRKYSPPPEYLLAKRLTTIGNLRLFSTWMNADGADELIKTYRYGEEEYLYIKDENGRTVWCSDIENTAAWGDAVLEVFKSASDYLEEWYETDEKAHTCDASNPQHDWDDVAATGNYRYGEEEIIQYCKRNGSHFKTDWRAHNHEGHWGAWQYQTVNGASVKIRYCQRCGKEDLYPAVDDGPLTCSEDSHVPLSLVATNGASRCGCVCGEVPPENFKNEQFHSWAANGNPACLCRCGHYHRGVAPSAYDVNREVACQNICTHCNRRHNSNGIDVPDAGAEDHQPRTSGHCGCRCGKYTHNDHDPECAKFHIRKAGDCCCLGADGSGGDWHFPCAKSGCTKICEYDYNGFGPHLAVTRKVNTDEYPLVTAQPKDHTRNDASCGCKCGDMSRQNLDEWNNIEELHKWQSGHCICVCGMSPEHHGISRQPCDNICRGYEARQQRSSEYKQCPLTVSGMRIGSNIKYSHTPRTDGCGCACGDFGAGDYSGNSLEDSLFHNGTGSPACWCSCGKNGQNAWHTFVTNNPCVNICNRCKETTSRGKTFRTKVVAVNPAKDHTTVTNRCGCECRAESSKNYKKYHPILDGHCGCVECNRNNYREHWYIDHVTEDNETGNGPSYTCGICGNTIGRIRHTVTCKTNPDGCWLCTPPYTYYVESGHAEGCGALPRDPSEDDEEDDTPIFGPPDDTPPAICTAVTFDGNVCGHKLNEDGSCPNEVNHNSSGSIDETGTSDTGDPGGNSGNTGGGTIDPLNF